MGVRIFPRRKCALRVRRAAVSSPLVSAAAPVCELLEERQFMSVSHAAGVTATMTEDRGFSGVVANFQSDNSSQTATAFAATINWGDGTSSTSGTVAAGSSGFTVAASHTYADTGSYTRTVTVSDSGSSKTAYAGVTVQADTSAPTLSAVAASSSEITLTYDGPSGSRLELEQKGPGDENFKVVNASLASSSDGATHTTQVTGLQEDTYYEFRIRADHEGAVQYASAGARTLLIEDPEGLPAPTNFAIATRSPEWNEEASHLTPVEFSWDWSGPEGVSVSFDSPLDVRLVDYPVGWSVPVPEVDIDGANATVNDGHYVAQGRFLNPGTHFQIRMKGTALSDTSDTLFSDWVDFTTPGTAPAAPTDVTVTANSGSPATRTVSWTAPSGGDDSFEVNYYEVRGLSATGATLSSNQVFSGTSVTVSANSSVVRYAVVAAGWYNDENDYFPDAASLPAYAPAPGATPAAPQNLGATLLTGVDSNLHVNLVWDNTSGNEAGFRVWRKLYNESTFTELTSSGGPAADESTFVDAGTYDLETTVYRVAAYNAAGQSSYAEVTVNVA